MIIFVGSTNPVKCNAVTAAASDQWPDVMVHGLSVETGVAEQPMSDEETRLGAENRAKATWLAGQTQLSKLSPTATAADCLAIGLEGGVFEHPSGELWSTVWAVVTDQTGQVWASNGARFKVPDAIASAIRQGGEMGPVVSQLTGKQNLKHLNGMIGVITQDFTNRTEEYTSIAKLALGLWYGREWDQHVA